MMRIEPAIQEARSMSFLPPSLAKIYAAVAAAM